MSNFAYKILEFEKIIKMLTSRAKTSFGRDLCEGLLPKTSFSEVSFALEETKESVEILNTTDIPFGGVRDIRHSLKRVKLGIILDTKDLQDILSTMYTMKNLKVFFKNLDLDSPILKEEAQNIEILGQLKNDIENIIDENGEIKDSATNDLMRIRNGIFQNKNKIKNTINGILKNPDYQKFFQENLVTIRNDRYVIPIKQEYRYQFQGIIHDQSSSGSTLFIEPMAIVDLNNKVKELILEEEKEVAKILRIISEKIMKSADILLENCSIIGKIDFAAAKGQLARKMRGIKAQLSKEKHILLNKCRHPLIKKEDVVPIDFVLGEDYRILLITGPNTGGKTVSMKTVALMCLMNQSGLFIPAEDGSKLCIFNNIYADIGDEQSIENSLSTFSSHMTNIIDILNKISEGDLLLLDEIGQGTDPEEGAALAMAIIEKLIDIKALVIATTHYNELKNFAYQNDCISNAQVEFDLDSLKPTYKLLIGTPGASNAFSISRRLGLSESIILRGKQLIRKEHENFTEVLNTLEREKLMYQQMNAEIAEKEAKINFLEENIKKENKILTQKKEDILKKAKEKAALILRNAKRESEEIIKELKANYDIYDKNEFQIKANKLRQDLQNNLDKVRINQENKNLGIKIDKEKLSIGDEVFVKSLNQKAIVLDKSKKDLTVQAGILKLNIKYEDCNFLKKAEKEKTIKTTKSKKFDQLSKVANIKTEIDIRGLMVDEAIEVLNKYIDDAVITNLPKIMIIHGKGTGALRKGIHQYLTKHPNVFKFTLANINEGGSGATEVLLK